jgi:hypothetical protein
VDIVNAVEETRAACRARQPPDVDTGRKPVRTRMRAKLARNQGRLAGDTPTVTVGGNALQLTDRPKPLTILQWVPSEIRRPPPGGRSLIERGTQEDPGASRCYDRWSALRWRLFV